WSQIRGSAHPFGGIAAGAWRKDDRAVAVQEDSPVDMGVNGTGKNLTFDIATERDIVFGALRMGDAHRVLLDDRAFVQVCRHVMRRRADQLYAALIGLLVGIGALEARQEGMVDIDDLARHRPAKLIR